MPSSKKPKPQSAPKNTNQAPPADLALQRLVRYAEPLVDYAGQVLSPVGVLAPNDYAAQSQKAVAFFQSTPPQEWSTSAVILHVLWDLTLAQVQEHEQHQREEKNRVFQKELQAMHDLAQKNPNPGVWAENMAGEMLRKRFEQALFSSIDNAPLKTIARKGVEDENVFWGETLAALVLKKADPQSITWLLSAIDVPAEKNRVDKKIEQKKVWAYALARLSQDPSVTPDTLVWLVQKMITRPNEDPSKSAPKNSKALIGQDLSTLFTHLGLNQRFDVCLGVFEKLIGQKKSDLVTLFDVFASSMTSSAFDDKTAGVRQNHLIAGIEALCKHITTHVKEEKNRSYAMGEALECALGKTKMSRNGLSSRQMLLSPENAVRLISAFLSTPAAPALHKHFLTRSGLDPVSSDPDVRKHDRALFRVLMEHIPKEQHATVGLFGVEKALSNSSNILAQADGLDLLLTAYKPYLSDDVVLDCIEKTAQVCVDATHQSTHLQRSTHSSQSPLYALNKMDVYAAFLHDPTQAAPRIKKCVDDVLACQINVNQNLKTILGQLDLSCAVENSVVSASHLPAKPKKM